MTFQYTEHTPGPWTFHRDDRYIETALPDLAGAHEHICDLRADLAGNLHTANANLIAAAPDMLGDCKDAALCIEQALRRVEIANQSGDMILNAWWADARIMLANLRATIAKAEGVAP